jgi:hypothetical protein
VCGSGAAGLAVNPMSLRAEAISRLMLICFARSSPLINPIRWTTSLKSWIGLKAWRALAPPGYSGSVVPAEPAHRLGAPPVSVLKPHSANRRTGVDLLRLALQGWGALTSSPAACCNSGRVCQGAPLWRRLIIIVAIPPPSRIGARLRSLGSELKITWEPGRFGWVYPLRGYHLCRIPLP